MAPSLLITSGGAAGTTPGDVASRQLAVMEAQQAETMRRLAEAKSKVDRNNFRCPTCHRVVHHHHHPPEGSKSKSPLVLCDSCPRSFHLECLGLSYKDLPYGSWRCPKCIEAEQAAVRRLMDLETRKKETLERAANRQKADEDKLLKRLLTKNGENGGSVVVRQPRRVLDDWEVLEEEREHLARLEDRLKELQAKMATSASPHHPSSPSPQLTDGVHGEERSEPRVTRMASSQPSLNGGGSGEGGGGVDGMDAAARAAETAEAIKRLEIILKGPPSEYPHILADKLSMDTLNEALTVAEFLALYGGACEVHKELSAPELLTAVAWPLDHAEDLSQLYTQLLLCCLLEQLNWEPPAKGRARRWNRILTESTWPEILRRYLLHRAASQQQQQQQQQQKQEQNDEGDAESDDDLNPDEKDNAFAQGSSPSRNKSVSAPMTTSPIIPQEEEMAAAISQDPAALDDIQFALHCATLLGQRAWWGLPSVAHLRLLSMLCYDISQGYTLRNDINTRLADCTKIMTDWGKELASLRRRKRAAENAAENVHKRRRSGKKAAAAAAAEEESGMADGGDEDDMMAEDETEDAATARRAREAEVEAKLEELAFRTAPLGSDRHDTRYWWLRGMQNLVLVETGEGAPAGAISSKAALDDLLMKLNRRGPKEQELHDNIRRKYDAIVESFESAPLPPDALKLSSIPRPTPSDGRQRQKDLSSLASLLEKSVMSDSKEKLESFLSETHDIGVPLSIEPKALKRELRAVGDSPAQLCDYMLRLEAIFCDAGDGLPVGATVSAVAALLGEDDAAGLPDIAPPPGIDTNDVVGGANPDDTKGDSAPDDVAQPMGDCAPDDVAQQMSAHVADATAREQPRGEDAAVFAAQPEKQKQENEQQEMHVKEEEEEEQGTCILAAPTETAAALIAGEKSGKEREEGTETETIRQDSEYQVEADLLPVTADDDMDDSDAEHAYLREKRMRRPARLWRSARERATWIKSARTASRALDSGVGAVQTAFVAYLLCDRAGPMLQRFITLAEETKKWEEEERARAKAEADRPSVGQAVPQGVVERPLMIRTGKAKTQGKRETKRERENTTQAAFVLHCTVLYCATHPNQQCNAIEAKIVRRIFD